MALHYPPAKADTVVAHYLPEQINFWTLAIVAVGMGFIVTVAVSIYLICQTTLDNPQPPFRRHRCTIRHVSHGSPDTVPGVSLNRMN
ncbi:uncharacterized protein LOC143026994 isoform X2 [Oratosquilla oratoria]|uniref:uncharacterized protein LOC143026994 isoform X2 n=1 Tax=Oratosquilla oratoria TaxID=337810 RepID=UPI003F772D99